MQRAHVPFFLLILSCVISVPTPIHATAYSIPVNGRFVTSRITLKIPSTPKWAHDIVLNASLAWNNGQLWFQHMYFPDGNVYTFVQSDHANVTVTYALPPLCSGLAVGWTDYTFGPSSTAIVSARTYLDPSVFNAAQESNVTARQYGFRLALHELGRVLGLGNLIDGNDIMDPLATPTRATQPPMISTIDLYALHVLASEASLTSLVIVLNTDQYQLLIASSLLISTNGVMSSIGSSAKQFTGLSSPRKSSVTNSKSTIEDHDDSVDQLAATGYATMLMVVVCAFSSLGITLYRSKRSSKLNNHEFALDSAPSNSHTCELLIYRSE